MEYWHRWEILAAVCSGLLCLALSLEAAVPGLPLTEDFTAANLQDPALTTASWDSDQEALVIASLRRHFNLFDASAAGVEAGAATLPTQGVALGDVNGDGLPDMVSANFNTPSVIRLNNGSADPYPAGAEINPLSARPSIAVALGDVDNDGDLDVVFANKGEPNSVYYNLGLNGGGSVIWSDEQQVAPTNSSSTHAVALGDLDNDGDLDIVFANDDGQKNFWYRNLGLEIGEITWKKIRLSSDAGYTRDVALADLDQDGDLDVVFANRGAGDVGESNRVYLNEGAALPFDFETVGDYLVDSWGGLIGDRASRGVALADLDGDGDIDAVVTNRAAANTGMENTYFLNLGLSGEAIEWRGFHISDDADISSGLVLADVDGDGAIDVIVANFNNTENKLYLNSGRNDYPFLRSTPVLLSSDSQSTIGLAADDIDNDGDIDVVMGNFNQQNRVVLNHGVGNPFSSISGSDVAAGEISTRSIALGDVNGDGKLDLVVGNWNQANRLYLNNGAADPFSGVIGSDITTDVHNTLSIALADLDDDGDLDLVAGNWRQTNRLYLNNGASDPFNGVTGSDITADAVDTWSTTLGDVDGDGDLDLVAGNWGQTNRLYLNNGASNPFNGVTGNDITADSQHTSSIALGDVDSDGDLDVVVGNSLEANRLYLNNGAATPFSGVMGSDITLDAHSTNAVALGDMDGDGDLDVVAGNSSEANRLYLNNGGNNPFNGVTGSSITSDDHSTLSITLGDVDSDDDLDVVAGNDFGVNRLYLNNGAAIPFSGTAGSDITTDSHTTWSTVLGDVDGDGDLDLVAGNRVEANRLYPSAFGALPTSGWGGASFGASNLALTSSIALADLDRDGDIDVVTSTTDVVVQSCVYLNNGTRNALSGQNCHALAVSSGVTKAAAISDINGDGFPDIVLGNTGVGGAENALYLNNRTNDPFAGVSRLIFAGNARATSTIVLGDMNNDGLLDVVEGNSGSVLNRLYLNNGCTTPSCNPFDTGILAIDFAGDGRDTRSLSIGDIDKDGWLDVVEGNDGFNQANRIYINKKSSLAPFESVTGVDFGGGGRQTRAVSIGDINNDGDLDVVEGNNDQSNRYYLNNGTATPFSGVSGTNFSGVGRSTNAIVLTDFDVDGDLDFIEGNGGFGGITDRIYLNNGSADPFQAVTGVNTLKPGKSTYSLAASDVNGDGLIDIVAGLDKQDSSDFDRVFSRDVVDTARDLSTSLAIDDEAGDITQVLLSASVIPGDASANTMVDFFLSNNGGAQWFHVQPDTQIPFNFPTTGSDLRWKAVLHSLSPVLTPRVNSLSIDLATDTDGDGIYNLFDPDDDNDGLSDEDEINIHGTDPLKSDTDGDGLSDNEEITIYDTDPLKSDTDGDGYNDGDEVKAGTDPLDPKSHLHQSKILLYFNVIQSAIVISQ